jgi:hypothetical protein
MDNFIQSAKLIENMFFVVFCLAGIGKFGAVIGLYFLRLIAEISDSAFYKVYCICTA